eukprot:6171117-Amphidinium_carterae.1
MKTTATSAATTRGKGQGKPGKVTNGIHRPGETKDIRTQTVIHYHGNWRIDKPFALDAMHLLYYVVTTTPIER